MNIEMSNTLFRLGEDLVDAGKRIIPLIVPGAGPIIEAGEKMADALDKLVYLNIGDAPDAAETRDQLRDRVNANLDRAIDKLA